MNDILSYFKYVISSAYDAEYAAGNTKISFSEWLKGVGVKAATDMVMQTIFDELDVTLEDLSESLDDIYALFKQILRRPLSDKQKDGIWEIIYAHCVDIEDQMY